MSARNVVVLSSVLLKSVWSWLVNANVSLPVRAGIVAVTELDGATESIVVVLVVPRTSWFVVLESVSDCPEILPIPEIFGVPDPVMLPVRLNPPMLLAAIVLIPRVPVDPLSVRLKSV